MDISTLLGVPYHTPSNAHEKAPREGADAPVRLDSKVLKIFYIHDACCLQLEILLF